MPDLSTAHFISTFPTATFVHKHYASETWNVQTEPHRRTVASCDPTVVRSGSSGITYVPPPPRLFNLNPSRITNAAPSCVPWLRRTLSPQATEFHFGWSDQSKSQFGFKFTVYKEPMSSKWVTFQCRMFSLSLSLSLSLSHTHTGYIHCSCLYVHLLCNNVTCTLYWLALLLLEIVDRWRCTTPTPPGFGAVLVRFLVWSLVLGTFLSPLYYALTKGDVFCIANVCQQCAMLRGLLVNKRR
jgi:hypothetical protein